MSLADIIQLGMFVIGFATLYFALKKQFNKTELYNDIIIRVTKLEMGEVNCSTNFKKELSDIKEMIDKLFNKIDNHLEKHLG